MLDRYKSQLNATIVPEMRSNPLGGIAKRNRFVLINKTKQFAC